MSVSVKDLGGLKRQLDIQVDAGEALAAYNKHLSKIAQQVKVDGFRPGKVPDTVVEQRYGSHVRQEMISELVQAHLTEKIEAEKLQVAGLPQVDVKDWTKNENFEFSATFEIYPEVTVQPLTGIAVERLVLAVSDDDVNRTLADLQKQHRTWETVERPCANGDQVVIDFKGTLNGEAFEGGTAEKQTLTLGDGQFIPGFEAQVEGMSVGDAGDITVTFPADYHSADLAGQEVVFAIVLHEIKEGRVPELDDAFAETLKIEGGIDGVREQVLNTLSEQADSQISSYMKQQVFDRLCEKNPLNIPEALVNQEMKALQDRQKQNMAMYYDKDKLEALELPEEPYRTQAKMRVHVGLLLAEVVNKYSLEASDADVEKKIATMVAHIPQKDQAEQWYRTNKEARGQVETLVLEDMVFDTLLGQMDVSDVSLDFEALTEKLKEYEKQQEKAV